ncbi:MAG: ribose 5-phosphate isomerase B [Bacteroidetes bacterium GWF2_42_66]|nr:MAG: ribose 5-phosphate isomerase B [Bacteroidetes bacterium GWA2_42_15]OFX97948.1 MAG: ribose 5-phosphate isomerase B [Bacteroidetes bacterium GWE2_42_39]OFY45815.1 MAG: ribose 5-phosphate isomerase B [Bacteroidetes bacterium GWF2_42_66]HBL74685.1 ribose 5-phosphate isomerase B [Prolixibacteraceae bacterium]HCR89440.1 ribose 5-phosphate isomerase B [Prolixibacteraceae bacterium]
MERIKIALACDHAGFERKQSIIEYLKEQGYEVKDFGAYSSESSDYPDWVHPMAEAVSSGEYQFGITFCGSGNGINMTANKHQKIRSAICWMPEIARLARQHNDANVCALPARYITDDEAREIVKIFLSTGFEGGRHLRRVQKIPVQ